MLSVVRPKHCLPCVLRPYLVSSLVVGENGATSLDIHRAVGVSLETVFGTGARMLGKNLMVLFVVNEHS